MAEGIAKKLYPNCIIQSAGSVPKEVNPNAIEVMGEIDIDISKHYSKDFESLDNKFRDELNTVFTLCKEEVCPVLNSKAQIFSIPFDDPASDHFSSNQLDKFREVRDSIFDKLKELKNLFEN
jgi:arsenate reductase